MIRPALLAMLLAAGSAAADGVPRATAYPRRVMSISQCTDELVLALLPRERIASVSWLARDPGLSLLSGPARRVPVNHGLGEEVLRDAPDLVVAGTFTSTATRALLKRLGWPLLEVGPADSIADIRATTRQVARAVGEPARGEALLARMDAQLADLARHPGPPLRVAAWDGGGFGAARGSLFDTLLTLAGATNVAAEAAARGGGPDSEVLLAAAPALLVRGGEGGGDLRTAVAQHPVVRRFWGPARSLTVSPAAYICGTPFIGDAALRLRGQLRAAVAAAGAPLPFARRSAR